MVQRLTIKLKAPLATRNEIIRLNDIFRGNVIDVSEDSYTIELTGTSDKLDAFINLFDCDSILETVRSGVMGISRGHTALHV